MTAAEDLKRHLEAPDFAGTISIPSNTEIDLDGYPSLPVRSCVTIKGTREGLDPGALLSRNIKHAEAFIEGLQAYHRRYGFAVVHPLWTLQELSSLTCRAAQREALDSGPAGGGTTACGAHDGPPGEAPGP